MYAPTTLAPARDFWMLRYTSVMEDGSLVVYTYETIFLMSFSFVSMFGSFDDIELIDADMWTVVEQYTKRAEYASISSFR